MGLLGFTLRKGRLFNDRGEYVDTQWFSKHAKTFKWRDRAYLVKTDNPSYLESKGLLWNTRFYFYNIDNPEPIVLTKNRDSIISATDFNTILESEVAKKLNDLANKGLSEFLTVKNVLIGLAAIGLLYLSFTGKLFGGTKAVVEPVKMFLGVLR